MKANLYNDFCHWRWSETPDTFRRWYESINYTNVREKTDEAGSKIENYYNPLLISAILDDIACSIYEFNPHKSADVNLQDVHMDYTDDTIMTIAVAD